MPAVAGRRILYQEVAGAIRDQIMSGKLMPGDQVGVSLAVMAGEHRVGIATVRAAVAALAGEGLVETIPGKGTFVLAAPAEGDQPASGSLAAVVARLQEDVADLKADVAELQSRRGIDRAARKRERANEQSG